MQIAGINSNGFGARFSNEGVFQFGLNQLRKICKNAGISGDVFEKELSKINGIFPSNDSIIGISEVYRVGWAEKKVNIRVLHYKDNDNIVSTDIFEDANPQQTLRNIIDGCKKIAEYIANKSKYAGCIGHIGMK